MYLLDTNVCISLINGRSPGIRKKFTEAISLNHSFAISSVVAFELWYGVGKSNFKLENTKRLESFFSGNFIYMEFDLHDAKIAGDLRADLESVGKPIGAYDILIASQAIRHDLTLITANVGEFSRIASLKWENWA